MILILFILKTILFLNMTDVQFNRILILIITSMITIGFISLIKQTKLKHKNTIFMIFYSIISFTMFIDTVYYSQFQVLPSVAMLGQAKQLTVLGDNIKSLINMKNILLIVDIPILIFLSLDLFHRFFTPTPCWNHIILTIMAFAIIHVNTIGQIQSLTAQELYFYHISDIAKNINKSKNRKNIDFTMEDLEDIKNRTNLKDGKLTGIGKDKNLIVLQVEALQSFVINLNYNNQEITPNLNRLIKDSSSLYYNRYYQLIGRGNTSDAEFVSHNSLHPSLEEPTYSQYEGNRFYGLPWLLRDRGYTAWAMHGYKKDFWNRERAYVSQGFQRFISEEDYNFDEIIGFGIRDEDFLKQSIEYLKELESINSNPFYAFIVTLTSHSPFNIPEEYCMLKIKPEHQDTILGNYLQAIHYADKEIGKFLEDLKREGLYDNTVIALYGDHFAIQNGEEEIDNIMTELLGYKYDYDSMMNIPLIIHVPGEEINETISTVGSPIDFYPTILNIMGYKNEKGLMLGRDLTNYKEENYVFPQTYLLKGSFIGKDTMFVMARDGLFDHSKAYDLNTREELDKNEFRKMYDEIIKEINKSDFILKKDLLRYYIDNNGEIDLSIFTEQNILKNKKIVSFYYNSLEELNKAYDKGHRVLAVDVELTVDDGIILLKDWYWYYDNLFENPKDRRLTLEEFKELKMKENKTQMTIEDLIEWMDKHKDAYIILRHGEVDNKVFVNAFKNYPVLIDRCIVEIKNFRQYLTVTYRGFNKVILNPMEENYTDEEILDFVTMHPHVGVILDKERAKTDLSKKLKKKGLSVYADTGKNIFKKQ
ncbi:sulfatase-like hydrolase/transferase [Tissierella praeacuta]|uniref:sulfatase-like hydrolase/transferase n=1 Tax=Tissierella praeacuta TaxID=43131 RepID=UPI001C11F327|nr:sulfatase-like hydrolase/transferase [Tissierella praeacuta]MBU5255520.1 sulfatase-like hydrolase/transferase [Tissierella praeacuta]